jgi:16S rRNA (cytidine1402-2'-O)-methyltransferase
VAPAPAESVGSAPGTLYIVSTPIGDPDDIGARALRVLGSADAVVCEERAEGERLLKRHGIRSTLVELNEHNEAAQTVELAEALRQGKTLALVSDAGTPLLHDPGFALARAAIGLGVRVAAVPGASALLAALVVSGLPISEFRYRGMLPAKREARRAEIAALRGERATCALLDAPYRLNAVLADLLEGLGGARRVAVACNLTMPDERVVRGTLAEVAAQFRQAPFKGEYVIVLAGR